MMMIERENVRIFFSPSPFFFRPFLLALSLSLVPLSLLRYVVNEREYVRSFGQVLVGEKKREENYPKKRRRNISPSKSTGNIEKIDTCLVRLMKFN